MAKDENVYEVPKRDVEKGTVMLGIPRERVYITQFIDNRDAIMADMQKAELYGGYWTVEGHRVDRNRDTIVEFFLSHPEKPEWLLMLDTDMEHPVDIATRLRSRGKAIVGALYFHRGGTHDPFIFNIGDKSYPDKWGREGHKKWIPARELVFDFLEANSVPLQDGSVVINNPIGEYLVECDAVATGAIMIHRSILENWKGEWGVLPMFEYKAGGASEDLTWCEDARAQGFKIWCDFSTISGHYHWVPMGQAQFRQMFINRGAELTTFGKADAMNWLHKFQGIKEEDAKAKIEGGNAHMVGNYWIAKFGKETPSPEEVEAFYKDEYTGELYLIELLYWNFTRVFNSIRSSLVDIRKANVVEIGSGIGTVAMQMAIQSCNVIAIEPNDTLRKFSEYRWDDLREKLTGHRGDITWEGDTSLDNIADGSQKAVISFDTFEHMPADLLQETLAKANRCLELSGWLIFHNNFSQQDMYPMHYDHSKEWDKWLTDAGFVLQSQGAALKIKEL